MFCEGIVAVRRPNSALMGVPSLAASVTMSGGNHLFLFIAGSGIRKRLIAERTVILHMQFIFVAPFVPLVSARMDFTETGRI